MFLRRVLLEGKTFISSKALRRNCIVNKNSNPVLLEICGVLEKKELKRKIEKGKESYTCSWFFVCLIVLVFIYFLEIGRINYKTSNISGSIAKK